MHCQSAGAITDTTTGVIMGVVTMAVRMIRKSVIIMFVLMLVYYVDEADEGSASNGGSIAECALHLRRLMAGGLIVRVLMIDCGDLSSDI
jgi:hypothetical protein